MANDNGADTPDEILIYWLQPWKFWRWGKSTDNGSYYPKPRKINWNEIKKLIDGVEDRVGAGA